MRGTMPNLARRFCTLVWLAAAGAGAQSPAALELTALSGRTSGDEGDGFAFAAVVENGPPPLLFVWDFGDGTAPVAKFDAAVMNHRYAEDGNYTVRLQVDGIGGSATRELEVVVRPAKPKIHLLLAEREAADPNTFAFTAEAADPGEEDELTYSWDFGDGSPPEQGVDRAETRHRFDRDGVYIVRLTVTDEDGLAATETRRILVGDAVDVTVRGALNTSIRSGKGPTSVCPVPLGDGGCGLHFQYWDDENRSYLFLQIYGNPLLEPRTVPMVQADARRLERGVPIAEATGIVAGGFSRDDYQAVQSFLQVTECRNTGMAGLASGFKKALGGGGMKALAKGFAGALGGGFGGGGQGASGGSGGGYVAVSGRLEVLSADEDRFAGSFTSTMQAEARGRPVTVEVEGDFAGVFDEFADTFLGYCEAGPFQVSDRFPGKDAKRVDFARPDVWVALTRPIAPESVSTEAIWLETLNAAGQPERVPVRLLHDGEGRRVHLLPIGGLDPARRYRIQVAGGEVGLRSRAGEKLGASETWSFATMPDLYREAAGGSTVAAAPGWPQAVPAVLRGRPGRSPAELALRAAAPPLVVPAQLAVSGGGVEPKVSCATYQTTRNMPLVTGKPTAFRVYLDWKLPEAAPEAQVRELEAAVEIVDGAGGPLPGLEPMGAPAPFVHRSVWEGQPALTQVAGHTANFVGWRASSAVGRVVARAKIEDAKGVEHTFEGECPLDHWGVADPTLRIGVFALPVGTWETELPDRRVVEKFLTGSVRFLVQNFPLAKATVDLRRAVLSAEDTRGSLQRVVLPETSTDSPPIVFNEARDMMLRLRDALRRDGLSYDVVVGLHPPNTEGWEQKGYNYSSPDGGSGTSSLFPTLTVRMELDQQESDGSMTLAHEVGHGFRLYHVPLTDDLNEAIEAWAAGVGPDPHRSPWRIEALRIASDGSDFLVKSTSEGNGETTTLLPLLFPHQRFLREVFITDANYVGLLRELERFFANQP